MIVSPDFHAVRQNLPALQFQKPQQDVHHRSLSRAGSPHDPYGASNGDFHISMVKNQYV